MKKVILRDLDKRPEQRFDYEYRQNGELFDLYENGKIIRNGINKNEVLDDVFIARNENYKVEIF